MISKPQMDDIRHGTSAVFDETAAGFAASTDLLLKESRYPRGEFFLRSAIAQIRTHGTILDYGCGPGRISLSLAKAGFSVLGLDTSSAMIEAANRQIVGNLDLNFRLCHTISALERESRYDGIVCSSVIEYVARPADLLGEFHRFLKPSGVLFISFANKFSLWRQWCRLTNPSVYLPAQRSTWSWPEFQGLLQKCGFAASVAPEYFESPLDGKQLLPARFTGSLGFVIAHKTTT
jgi:2-polyprenyl-3-methyl-5-hydroxy-6-metoxy-1,4-benzoquinol methylase